VAVTTVRLPLKLTHSHPWPGWFLPNLPVSGMGEPPPPLLPRRLPIKVAAANVLFFGLFRLSRLPKYMRVCRCPFTMSVFVWQPLLCCLGVAVANDNDLLWLKGARSGRNLIRPQQLPRREISLQMSASDCHPNPFAWTWIIHFKESFVEFFNIFIIFVRIL